jgi:hypothetical protein
MRLTLTALIRLASFVGLGLFVVALGLSRAVPRPSTFRTANPPRYFAINGSIFKDPEASSLVLDTETGVLARFEAPEGMRVENASCSPWVADANEVEFVGRVSISRGQDTGKVYDSSGLGRFKMSSGLPIVAMSLEPAIVGRPCWLPGSPTRILFPGGDGLLYVRDLAGIGVDDPDQAEAREAPARRVSWRCRTPDNGPVLIGDVSCLVAPEFGGRILVSLSRGREKYADEFRYASSEIWWLKLDAEGREIIAAGRLTAPSAEGPLANREEERMPSMVVAPGGRLVLAYLSRRQGEASWRMRLVPVDVGPDGADPVVRGSEACLVADDCSVTPPAFSADGRWLYRVGRVRSSRDVIRRFSVVEALDGRSRASALASAGSSQAH